MLYAEANLFASVWLPWAPGVLAWACDRVVTQRYFFLFFLSSSQGPRDSGNGLTGTLSPGSGLYVDFHTRVVSHMFINTNRLILAPLLG